VVKGKRGKCDGARNGRWSGSEGKKGRMPNFTLRETFSIIL